ncbi:MAG: hypothetical protein CMP48_03115 [Rickettsiales bacterium]|nr:hypothetical protein [Rickettsiales bacterium]
MNTGDKTDDRKHFMALADMMLEDIFESADDEIVQEIVDGDEGLDALRKRMSNNVAIAEERAGEARRRVARQKLKDRKARATNIVSIDPATARRKVEEALRRDDLSMAARNETSSELSDDEILQKYRDLVDLGVIKPEDGGQA